VSGASTGPCSELYRLPPAQSHSPAELKARLARIRDGMSRDGLDAIILSDKKNIECVTDLQTLSWAYKARPMFVLITDAVLVLIGGAPERRNIERARRIFEPRYYSGYLPEAVDLLAAALREQAANLRIGVDYGQDMFGRGSLELIAALNSVTTHPVTSCATTLWKVRLVKSRAEIRRKRIAFDIVNRAFDEIIALARLGMPEFELCQMIQARIYANGAESADPIAMVFGQGDFAYCRPPSTRQLEIGDYIWTDFRATYGGYPADRNRIARAGPAELWEIDLYRSMRAMTIALANSIRPGMTCAQVYQEFERLNEYPTRSFYGAVSRIGHGGGLDVTEPPSISPTDETIIQAGMILHIEPKVEERGAVFQFEEVVAVGPTGVEFISALSPADCPIVN
jgi:Xaa-Pro dipeptidase